MNFILVHDTWYYNIIHTCIQGLNSKLSYQSVQTKIWYLKSFKPDFRYVENKQEAHVGHCRSPEYNERVKTWHQNGTKHNKASSNMLQDHCYAFSLLL